jgi:hypothetical protein
VLFRWDAFVEQALATEAERFARERAHQAACWTAVGVLRRAFACGPAGNEARAALTVLERLLLQDDRLGRGL